jgi:porin
MKRTLMTGLVISLMVNGMAVMGQEPVSEESGALVKPDPLQVMADFVNDIRGQLEGYGITIDLGLTSVFQAASDTVDEQDTLWSFSYDFAGEWMMVNDPNLGEGGLGWLVEGGRPLGNNRFEDLSANVGSNLGINDDLDSESIVVSEFWWQHNFRDQFLFTIGKIDETAFFDTNRVANDETTQFLATPLVNNTAIAFPENGLGLNATYFPDEFWYVSAGAHDSNSVSRHAPFETIDNEEFFVAAEAGVMPEFQGLGQGAYRLMVWTTEIEDERGSGVAFSMDQEIMPKVVPFFRIGYSDNGEINAYRYAASGGVGFEQPFGRVNDMFGIGYAWADPVDNTVEEESIFEMFYRLQLTDTVQITPDVQVVFDPAGNTEEQTVVIGGVRAQVSF